MGKDRARLTICLKNLYNLCGIGGCPPPYQRSEQSIERLIPQVMPGELEIGQRRFAQGRSRARQLEGAGDGPAFDAKLGERPLSQIHSSGSAATSSDPSQPLHGEPIRHT